MNVLEILYYLGYRVSRGSRTFRKRTLSHPVISVGNLTLGGTGKTPTVIAIAQEALRRGYRPCILTRGYKGKIRNPVFVSRGSGPLHSPVEVGDEAVLMAERLKGVEIVKSPNRYKGGLMSQTADLFIIDDGYQHRQLHRDHDILLIDHIDPFGNGKLLPLGRLREPVKEVKRADTILITRPSGEDGIIEKLKNHNPRAHYFTSHVRPSKLVKQNGDHVSTEHLAEKRVYAFCGIGNPGGFVQTLVRFGVSLVGFKSFQDHHIYKPDEIALMEEEAKRTKADLIVTTEKDMVKLGEITLPESFLALRIDIDIDETFYDRIFDFNKKNDPTSKRRTA